MKKVHLLIIALIAVAVSVGFVACGGDDDEGEGGNGPSGGGNVDPSDYAALIVGAWSETGAEMSATDGNNDGFVFHADGSYVEYCAGMYNGTYEINGDKLLLYEEGDYDSEEYKIHSITKDKLVLEVVGEDDAVFTLYRVGSNVGSDPEPAQPSDDIARKILGTWTQTGEYTGDHPDENGYNCGFTFDADGTVTEFGSGRYESTYRISGQCLMIYDDYYDEYDEYLIVELTDDKLVLRDMDDPEYGDDIYYRVK